MQRIRSNVFITAGLTTLAWIIFYVSPLKAQTTSTTSNAENYLQQISTYTYGTLTQINNLPIYLRQLTILVLSWLAPDDSAATAALQGSFTTLTNAAVQNAVTRASIQPQLLSDFFKNTTQLPPYNANDLTYQTLLGNLYINPDRRKNVDPSYHYLVNAAGLNVKHLVPGNWSGDGNIFPLMYSNYINTVSAVQTFNGYILSEAYANSKNNGQLKQTQDQLVQQASSSDWFTQIAAENLGIVLRQILLYNSQTYILLTRLLETQKQILTAQTMTNALLIVVNQPTEDILYKKASGRMPHF
jgi:hypothetical protein